MRELKQLVLDKSRHDGKTFAQFEARRFLDEKTIEEAKDTSEAARRQGIALAGGVEQVVTILVQMLGFGVPPREIEPLSPRLPGEMPRLGESHQVNCPAAFAREA